MAFSKHRLATCCQLFLLAVLASYFASCSVGRHIPTEPPAQVVSTKQQEIVNFGKQFLGVRYRFGGRTPAGFDCSGFTVYVFNQFGIRLNPTSATQDTQFPTISRQQDLRVGDLVFFEGRTQNQRVGHVGIVSEVFPNGTFRFIHASVSQGVTISHSTEQYWAVRYLRGGRVLPDEVVMASSGQRTRMEPTPPATNRRTRLVNNNQNNAFTPIASTTQSATSVVNEPIVLVNQSSTAPLTNNRNNNDTPPIVLINNDVIRRDDTHVPPPETTNAEQRTHLVQSGETLFSISRQYNVSVEQIRQWNPQMGNVLRAGESLVIHPQ